MTNEPIKSTFDEPIPTLAEFLPSGWTILESKPGESDDFFLLNGVKVARLFFTKGRFYITESFATDKKFVEKILDEASEDLRLAREDWHDRRVAFENEQTRLAKEAACREADAAIAAWI